MLINNFFWVRQPLISMERLLYVLASKDIAGTFNDELIQEALSTATDLFDEKSDEKFKNNPSLYETGVKYLLRMSTRCTPFGTFAGISLGNTGLVTNFDFTNRRLTRYHRLDMQVLAKLVDKINKNEDIRYHQYYYSNRSIYIIGYRLRYTERQCIDDKWVYYTSEITVTDHLLCVLRVARLGATVQQIIQELGMHDDNLEAYNFVNQLIADGLLVSELSLTPTGPDPLLTLINKLNILSPVSTLLADLKIVYSLLDQTSNIIALKQQTKRILGENLALSNLPNSLIQTDLSIEGANIIINQSVINQLQKTLQNLFALNSQKEPEDLELFKKRFHARYADQEIPLLVAMDPEVGIGYGNSSKTVISSSTLIDGLLSKQIGSVSVGKYDADELHDLRLKLFSNWKNNQSNVVELLDVDLENLKSIPQTLPMSYYALGYFLANSTQAIDKNQFQFFLKVMAGPSAFNLLGRFCSNSPALSGFIRDSFIQQQNNEPDAIFAEVAHLPQARTGNVVQRPHFCTFEIPYLVQSTLPDNQQISPDDLMISVPKGQRVLLRSKRLNKVVIPQLSTAHNYREGLPLYRFLCDLQYQYNALSVRWDWGAFTQARHLPRVIYKNIILKEACWIFSWSDIQSNYSDEENIRRLQSECNVPRLVAIQQGDKELFLDLETEICQQLFLSTLRRLEIIRVIEWLRTPDKCPVDGPDGKMTHEIVLPFIGPSSTRQSSYQSFPHKENRSFAPGSEWLFVKVYCGLSTTHIILLQLATFIQQKIVAGKVNQWFFVRYNDPETHFRLRIRLADCNELSPILADLHHNLKQYTLTGEVSDWSLDTYHRELERYNLVGIDITENLFWRDSELVTQLYALNLNGSLLAAAVLGIDAFYTQFGLPLPTKATLSEKIFTDLFVEHGATKELREELAQQYRINYPLLSRLFSQRFTEDEKLVAELVRRRSELIEEVSDLSIYYSLDTEHQLGDYINSIIHMFINRLFDTNQRTYELLLHHHLYRFYHSIQMRSK